MRVAIMQPTYLPWIGYFDMIDQVDLFVLLDVVQFERRSWQSRNRIKTAQGVKWLTVPVRHVAREAEIRSIEINDDLGWRSEHLETLRHAYARASHWRALEPEIRRGYSLSFTRLQEVNEWFITSFAERLGIDLRGGARVLRASDLVARGRRQDLLLAICRELGATEYLSAAGSLAYLREYDPITAAGIRLLYHQYEHPIYEQMHGEFVPFLSVIDLLANAGPQGGSILRSGRRPAAAGH